MPDHEDSLDGETLDGDAKADPAKQSLGDGSTLGGGDTSSLSDTSEVGGEHIGAGLPVIDLEARFEIEDKLGQGGMGAVLLARDKSLGRQVAIKRILETKNRTPAAINRFITEAKSIAALNHPNIVQIHEFGQDDDVPLIVFEYVSGGSLLDRLKKGKLDPEEAIRITCQLCDALSSIHDKEIIHRDIKPANILMTVDGVAKLTDFGLAKQQNTNPGQTTVGAIMGTIEYMPPEQKRDSSIVDKRSDLYSLAATFYEMLTGKRPYKINITLLPPKLQPVVDKATEELREDRFQSAMEMRDAILQAHSGKMDRSRTLDEGECPQCATLNPADQKFCRDCSAQLQVNCLGCLNEIAIWDNGCGACGKQQGPLVKDALADLKDAHDQAERFLIDLEFDDALKAASVIGEQGDPRLLQFSTWHEEFSIRLESSRTSEYARLEELLREALAHEQAYDYEAGLQSLTQVAPSLKQTAVNGSEDTADVLAERLTAKQTRFKELEEDVDTRVAKQEMSGLLRMVDELVKLKPGRPKVQKLKEQLEKRDAELLEARDAAINKATQQLGEQQYAEAVATLKTVSKEVSSEQLEELKTKAMLHLISLNTMRDRITTAVDGNQLKGLLPAVEECLTLKADQDDFLKLKDQLEKRDTDLLEARGAAINKATQQLSEQQYAEAVATLNTVAEEVSSMQVEELKTKASDLVNELKILRDRITTAVDGNQLKGLLPAVEECLLLKADQDDILKLEEQLIDHDAQINVRNQQIFSQAKQHLQELQFDAAVQTIDTIGSDFQTLTMSGLRQQAQELSVLRQRVLSALPAALSEMSILRVTIKNINNYLIQVAEAGIQDPQLQQMLDDAKDKEAVSIRNRKLITLGITAACVVVFLIIGVVVKISHDRLAVKTAIAHENWETALELDSDNATALRMQAAAVASALANGDWKTALNLDPSNRDGLRLKEDAAVEKAAILAGDPITNMFDMTFNNIPAGTFMMGSSTDTLNEYKHKVTISRPFYMQTTEVTQGQWMAVMETEPWFGKANVVEGPNYAASYVSWNDAVAYCKKLNKKEGKTYRLPKEAEWEYACRAGTTTTWSFGNDEKVLGDYAWYIENAEDTGEQYAHQVGQKKPNAFGLYDMHGNVFEWCRDYYGEDYYKQSPKKDPMGPASGPFRVLRGGSWGNFSRYARSAYRFGNDADGRAFNFGFRLVRDIPANVFVVR